jgi:hypothetical protein
MPFVPADTAIVVEIGPLIDRTDFFSLEEAIAYNETNMAVDLIKNSITGTIAKVDITPTTGGTNDWTHRGNGVYELEITAAQNDTEGTLRVVGLCDGVLPFESPVYTVVPTQVFNSLVAGTDKLQVDAFEISSSTTAADNVEANIGNLDAAVSGRSSHSAADVWTAGGRTLTAATNITSTGNAVGLHTDDKVLLGGTTHTGAVIPNVTLTATTTDVTNGVTASTVSDKTGYSLAADQAVNTTKWAGSAVSNGGVSGLPAVDAQAVSDDTTAANNLELITENARGADNKILISTDAQDLSATLDVNAKAISASTAAADNVEANIGNLDAAISTRSSHTAANVWAEAGRTLTAATNITSTGNAVVLHTDDKVLLGGTTHTGAIIPQVTDVTGETPAVINDTTISSVTSQTEFVIAAGADFDDAYNDQTVVVYDVTNNNYPSIRKITDYTGASKTVFISTAPAFTIASSDVVKIFQAQPGATAPTAGEVADAVWDEAKAGHTGDLKTVADNVDVVLSTRSSHSAADVWSAGARTLTAATNITSTGNAVGLHTDDKVLLGGTTHTSAVIPTVTTTTTATSVTNDVNLNMSQTTPGSPTADTVGEALRFSHENLDAAITSRSSHAAADIWSVGTRTLTGATNITSTGNAIGLHTDDKVLLGGTTHTGAIIPNVTLTATTTNVTNGVTASTVSDKTGYSLTADQSGVTVGTVNALGTTAKNDVNAEVDTALGDARLDELMTAALGSQPTAGSMFADLTEDDGGTQRFNTNALEQAPTGGTNPNVLVDTTIDAITSQTEFTLIAGSNDDNAYDDQAIVLTDASDNDYPSVRKVNSYTGSTKTVVIDSAPDFTIIAGDGVKIFVTAPGSTAPTAAQVADAVWDESKSGHTGDLKTVADNVDVVLSTRSSHNAAAIWAEGTRTLSAATNITSTGNAVGLHTDDKVLLGGTTHTSAVIPNVTLTATTTDVTNAVTAGTVSDKTGYSLAADQAVNTTKWAGSAVSNGGVSGLPAVDAQAISDNAAAADNVQSNIGNLDAAVSSCSTHSAADVWSVGARTLTAATNITSNGNAITLHTDDKVIIAGTTHTGSVISNVVNGVQLDWADVVPDPGTANTIGRAIRRCLEDIAPVTLVDTIISSVTSQTEFVITAGADFNDAYNGMTIIFMDVTNNDYPSVRRITDYTGSSKTVFIDSAPDFTIATSDAVKIVVTNTDTQPVNVTTWNGTSVSVGGTSNLPAVDSQAISDDTTTADNVQSNIGNLDATVSSRSDFDETTDLVDLNADQSGVTVGTVNALGTTAKSDVNAEVDTAIGDARLDELMISALGSQPTAGSMFADLTEDDGGTQRFNTNALEQAPTGGTNPNVLVDTTIASITSQTEFVLTAGSNDDNAYNDQAIVLTDASDNDYPSVRVVTAYTGSTKTVTIDSAPDFTIIGGDGVKIFVTAPGSAAPTAAVVADAVWDESKSGHTGDLKTIADNVDVVLSTRSSHAAADIWSVVTRTLTAASNITSTGNAVVLHTDDKVLLGGTTHTGAVVPTVTDVTNAVTAGTVGDKTGYSLVADQSAVTVGTVNALGTQAKADVNAEVDTAIGDARLDELMTSALGSQPTAGSVIGDLTEDDAGTQRFSANALEQAPGASLTAGEVADAVWDEAQADHVGAGTTGESLDDAASGGGGGGTSAETKVLASFDVRNHIITMVSWLEIGGTVETTVSSCAFAVYTEDGVEVLASVSDTAPNSQYIFKTEESVTLSAGTNYIVTATITLDDASTYSGRAFIVVAR